MLSPKPPGPNRPREQATPLPPPTQQPWPALSTLRARPPARERERDDHPTVCPNP